MARVIDHDWKASETSGDYMERVLTDESINFFEMKTGRSFIWEKKTKEEQDEHVYNMCHSALGSADDKKKGTDMFLSNLRIDWTSNFFGKDNMLVLPQDTLVLWNKTSPFVVYFDKMRQRMLVT